MANDLQNTSSLIHIGDYLKARREESKLSIEKVSQKTKINLNILRALEANNFQALPSPAYIKGFVMSYARVVGLTPDDVIHKLEYSYLTIMGKPFPALNHTRYFAQAEPEPEASANNQETPVKKKVSDDPAKVLEQEKRSQERQKVVVPTVVFVGVCIVFIGLYQLVTKTIDSETNDQSTKPYGPTFVPSSELLDINKPVAEKKEETQVKSEETPPPATSVSSPENKTPETPAAAPAQTTQPVRRNFPHKDFRKITVRLFAVIPDAPENQDEDVLPDRIKDAYNKEMENIFVTATDGNTWLSYKIDQSPIESVILEKGKNLFLQGKEVLMFLGNSKVTKIFYQNRLIDAPTKTGFKSLIFPESQASKHMLPLFPKAADDILYTAEEYQRRMKIEEEELGSAPKP